MPPSLSNTLSLYLHIPFCTTRCTYCAFNTYANLNQLIDAFVHALAQEITFVAETNPYGSVGTVFFGGGTPSLLTPKQFDFLISGIRQNFVVENDAEITAEANPNNLEIDYLSAIRDAGINRLSIGMQSAITRELDLFARRHHHGTTARAVEAARAIGFNNLNLDLIYGIPYQTLRDWEHSLNKLIGLEPEHVSMYALGLEPGTAMDAWVQGGQLPSPDEDLVADMYELATNIMKENCFEQYEISNWSKPGFQCRHNLQYWRNLPYLGFGPGAHGFAGGVRYSTILSPRQYVKVVVEQPGPFVFPQSAATLEASRLTREEEIAETLMMSLRLTEEGVQRRLFQERFGTDIMDLHGPIFRRFVTNGLVEVQSDRIRLTERGRLLSNVVFRELI